jgi:uncharacterized protein (TIGR02646 family)
VKHIHKGGSPHIYAQWRASVAGTGKEHYGELPKAEKQALLTALIAEQGALCAYTMRRIDQRSSHVEHIKPESLCRLDQAGSDLDYENLVACFPREGMKAAYRYGAQRKGDWWDNGGASFVSPLHPACEKRFRFDVDGTVTAVGNYGPAITTIEVLKLDHPNLQEDRKRAIQEFVFGSGGAEPLSQAKAKQALGAVCSRNGHGEFYEFCIAIRDAVDQHMKVLRRRGQRTKATRKRKRS